MNRGITIPAWACTVILTAFLSVFVIGWAKIDHMDEEITVERTSRQYIEKRLDKIDNSLELLHKKIDKLQGMKDGS
jgi:peptidoglycan hydrolase CwlO-like protein